MRTSGVLAIVAFARTDWRELPWATAAFIARGAANRARGKWEHSAPTVWPRVDTVRQLRAVAQTELPGARISRLVFGRVLIHWLPPMSVGSDAGTPIAHRPPRTGQLVPRASVSLPRACARRGFDRTVDSAKEHESLIHAADADSIDSLRYSSSTRAW